MPIYMKYEGIEGEATGKYKGWIELQSCQIGGRTSRSVSEIVITKYQDNSSPGLVRESLQGAGKKVRIDFVKGNEAPYLSIEIENVLILSYNVSRHGGSQSDKPVESLSLNFTKITYTSTAMSTSKDPAYGKDKVIWDLAVTKGS